MDLNKIEDFYRYLKLENAIELTKEQKEAIETCNIPTLVLAVPGSGKTTSLVIKAGFLAEVLGYNPKKILMLTFSKSASENLESRFIKYFKGRIDTPIFGTIHKFSNSVLKHYEKISNIRYTNIERGHGDNNKYNIIKKIYKEINEERINDDKLEELCGYLTYIKNYMLSDEEILNKSFEKKIPNFYFIYKKYEQHKRMNNLIDFDDMLYVCYNILKENPEFLKSIQKSFDYILIDEAQDTSKLQYEIIKLLCESHKRLFVIGDEDQNLYSWRGSYLEFLLNFQETYNPSKVIFIEQNFRSSKSITNLANAFIKTNRMRYKKDIKSTKESYGKVNFLESEDDNVQCEDIVKDLLIREDDKTYAILYRHNICSYYMAYKLMKHDIPFKLQSYSESFFSHWIVSDIINYLNFALNNKNFSIFEKIYYKSYKYLSKDCIARAKLLNKDCSVFEKLISLGLRKNIESAMKNMESKFASLIGKTPYEAIKDIEYTLNYRDYISEQGRKSGYSRENMNKILSTMKLIASDYDNVHDFLNALENLNKIIQESYSTSENRNVILSTIHSCKGLEYDDVYILDLIDKTFPSAESISCACQEDFSLLEEERRVFYVAMTRAKKNLTICTVKQRNEDILEPSRFFTTSKQIYQEYYKREKNNLILYDEMLVFHKEFGMGVINEKDENTCLVKFLSGKFVCFSIKNCLEDRILRPVYDKITG